MKILTNATALDSRGGYSVIHDFLYEISNKSNVLREKQIELTALVAKENLCKYETEQLKVIYEPYPKKSPIHKWKYENRILPSLIKANKFDFYLSLQNSGLPYLDIPQYVLIHQPIPFSDLKPKELELKNFIKYKVLLHSIYKRQLANVDGVFVQTSWMKEAIQRKYSYKKNIHIIRPAIQSIENNVSPLGSTHDKEFSRMETKLLYMTNREKYKNNAILIEAIQEWNAQNTNKVVLYLTLDGQSTEHIRYIGKIPYESIFKAYKSVDALIFPSLTETLGLPLLEAQEAGLPILAADLPYAREVCGSNAIYFNPRSKTAIMRSIGNFLKNRYARNPGQFHEKSILTSNDNYMDYIRIIHSHTDKYHGIAKTNEMLGGT
ncbi:glycosyltransferase [Paenibacillus sedimenti]|uniref:Glycosyltransferase n=1 Tax=Paenibacillus sedimenti TaxID=2770274 RepID=A0A926QIM8_9BACL|nr:glycosyltransferase [Paenibacillus sedimenti]MBD0379783.1 glycosyltransferase [Paenibacillus sedimenti]